MTLQYALPSLAPDLTVRPPTLEDAQAVCDFVNLNAVALTGKPDEDLDEIISEWTEPTFDLARDAVLGFDADGRVAAYGIIYLDRPMVPYFDMYLHPDRWGKDDITEDALFAWAQNRAREGMARVTDDAMRVTFGAWSYAHDARYIAVLERHGLQSKRGSFQMRIDFAEPPLPPDPVPGIVIRPYEESDTHRAVLEAMLDGWRDHRGYIERDFEERLGLFDHDWKDTYVPGAWLLALEGERIVGVSLNAPNFESEEPVGSVYTLSVRRDSRRRGIAMALLQQSFVTLHAMGRSAVNLWVDAASLTGATRLYERAGMRVVMNYTYYETELRPGYDPSVQALATEA